MWRSAFAVAIVASALIFFGLSGWASPPLSAMDSRLAASDDAARILLRTHLYTDGRGMHFAAPVIVPTLQFFQNPWIPVDVNGAFGRHLGANMQDRQAVGMFPIEHEGTPVVALGCVLCHSGRAAGRLYVGLGNKRIDVGNMGSLGHSIARPYQLASRAYPLPGSDMVERSIPYARLLMDPRWTNPTRGLVPDALIQSWFYRAAGLEMPDNLPAAQVKVPQLWGYGEKRKVGLFTDGLGDGSTPGWAAMVELALGQTAETVRGYQHRLEDVEKLLEQLLPPRYPFSIDRKLAAEGEGVFRATCSGCHGEYRRDAKGYPIYAAPRHIRWETVGTDPQRLLCITPEFRRLIETSPLAALIKAQSLAPGYFAPRLDGVWARFPYLHNASVPTVRDLLTPTRERPKIWSLADAGEASRFDAAALGLDISRDSFSISLLRMQSMVGDRDIFVTDKPGVSNQGHEFGTGLPEDRKLALIEYLKTL
jgi:cytochrome c5